MNAFTENIKLFWKQTNTKTEKIISRILFNNSMTLSTAESCTGGLISSRLTDVAGSSAYIKENFVTYSNEAKISLLGVKKETLEKYGAVSEECATEMVQGLFERTNCDVCLVTTGIAGPDGGTKEKPVGTLYVAVKNNFNLKVKKFNLNPKYPRKTMKFLFSQHTLEFLAEFLDEISKNK